MAEDETDGVPFRHDDPAQFSRQVLGLEPTGQQEEFFAAIARPGAHVAVRSGHGTGKSTALAAVALWFLMTRRDALVPCTAPTAHQLQDVLWREMRRLALRMNEETRRLLSVTSDRITLRESGGLIVARTARPENPDALQGFHSPEMLFVIDEAAGVHDGIFEVAHGALSTASARVAMTGNPTRLTGYFHGAFHVSRENWIRLHFSCLESPLVAPEYAAGIAAEYGEDSDVYRVRVTGDFPRVGAFNLVSLEDVEAALARTAPPGFERHKPMIFGVDPAWMGTDRSAIALRQGMYATILFVGRKLDTSQLAELVARKAEELRPDAIFVDQTGVGAGVYDQLKTLRHSVTGIAFSQQPLEPQRFANRRAEMWWRLREWLESGPVIDAGSALRDDLVGPEYHLTADGKVQLEAKDSMRARGLASPDLGDALALTFAAPVGPLRRGSSPTTQARSYNVYEWMERK